MSSYNAIAKNEYMSRLAAWQRSFFHRKENIYCVGLFFWILSYIVSDVFFRNEISLLVSVLRIGGLSLAVFNELVSRVRYKRIDCVCLLLLLLILISAIVSHRTSFLLAFLMVFLARNVRFEAILTTFLFSVGFGLLAVSVLSFIGVIDQNVVIAGGRLRSSLGFSWPSAAPNYVLTLVFVYVLRASMYGEKPKISALLLFELLSLIVFCLCQARSPFAMTTLLVVLAVVVRLRPIKIKKNTFLSWFLTLIFVFCATLILLASFFYSSDSTEWQQINIFFSNRLDYSNFAMHEYPITLFGSDVFGHQNDAFFAGYLDSGYLFLLYAYGASTFAIIIFAYTRLMKGAIETSDTFLVVVLLIVAIQAMFEGQITMLQFEPTLFLLISGARKRPAHAESSIEEGEEALGREYREL